MDIVNDDRSTLRAYAIDMNDLYQAYMIRFSRNNGDAAWRVMLRSADSETTEHFSTERELFLYLMMQLATQPSASDIHPPINES